MSSGDSKNIRNSRPQTVRSGQASPTAPSTGFAVASPKIRQINVRCSLRNKLFVSLVRATCHYHRALVAKRRPLHSCKPLSSLLKKIIKVPLSINISYEHQSRGANRSMSAGLPGVFSVTIVSAIYVYRTRLFLTKNMTGTCKLLATNWACYDTCSNVILPH